MWSTIPPSSHLALDGALLILNPSASDELVGKADYRRELVRNQSARCVAAYAYASSGVGESTMDTVCGGHCIAAENGAVVSTIEHIMAALSVCGITNALIEVNNQETPIMDGSGKVFYEALKNAEIVEQQMPEKILRVMKEVSFVDAKGNKVTLSPADDFYIDFEIDFPSKIVGHQTFSNKITPDIFENEIAPCRTFCEKYQVDYLQSIGLIKGGSLDNAVVLDGETILNPGGFRVENECVNHKVLDAVGDLYTSGYRMQGHLNAVKTGHYHNNELLKILFSDKSNYKLI